MTDKLQTLHAEQGTDGTEHWWHQSHDHLHMLELVVMLSLEVNEKEQAPLGQRIRAVGMCFYKKGDLTKGNNYHQLTYQQQWLLLTPILKLSRETQSSNTNSYFKSSMYADRPNHEMLPGK